MIDAQSTTLSPPSTSAEGNAGRKPGLAAASALSFGELLAGLRVAKPSTHQGGATPAQMLKQSPVTAKDRRAAELRETYESEVAQKSERLTRARREARANGHERVDQNNESNPPAGEPTAVRSELDGVRRTGHDITTVPRPDSAHNQSARAPLSNQSDLHTSIVRSDSGQNASKVNPPLVDAGPIARAQQSQTGVTPVSAASEVGRALTSASSSKGDVVLPTGFAAASVDSRQGSGESRRAEVQKSPQGSDPPRSQPETRTDSTVSKFEQLVRALRTSSGRHSTARVLLDPPNLGRMHVRVTVAGDRVDIGVETENEAARQLIVGRALKLKSILEQQGLSVDRFDVSTHRGGLFDARVAEALPAWPENRDQPVARERESEVRRRYRAAGPVSAQRSSFSSNFEANVEIEA